MTDQEHKSPMAVSTVKIPQAAIDFANAVADLAEANSVDEVDMKIKMDFDLRCEADNHQEITIYYRASDGRGRPKRHMRLSFNTYCHMSLLNDKPNTF